MCPFQFLVSDNFSTNVFNLNNQNQKVKNRFFIFFFILSSDMDFLFFLPPDIGFLFFFFQSLNLN
ncbi:hypothetical protein COY65_00470 [Candidatus Jorgensenbacteria bacterium CG_4_10_14_0_8_um_filter_39_13]|uniref:Uncharacterized protein n=2 Tax=Candidatus Joergenseniibacteriota TaxID=1752739 RepID=A0A2M7RIK1_9BACT|nr:MAG: hypothetical protein COV54_02775 [Candidatus Jorgensenbacteria bacterium CG11_big_fil_rev_8_21_14_0_20_38_23]PIV13096.1 MAG: hypothetical protein COS46_01790 [Candidatus Jorgensenbacteria bacterium CG03_land_8_20_14_0_80_38_39]PIW97670.1 MAG: hypothetical protein COZ81_01390 [Candidatus Jorgensenbacteria bacterium CG_4_8_14_3_um_filter_38_10]PIY96534.1 MAG: hypothetical protein COY65_00470 [Candidatus Jorgensenbacteria bacterium CG_4_10_14_0_8_um_filter_39_13]PJA94976.1 MAG: hypothetica